MSWLMFFPAIGMFIGLAWIRAGNGGSFGKHIRHSDWLAWKDAVDETEQKLAALKAAEPKQ